MAGARHGRAVHRSSRQPTKRSSQLELKAKERPSEQRSCTQTFVVTERAEEAVARVLELTNGMGVDSVLECVGTEQAVHTALGIVRPGGAIGRVGVPHHAAIDLSGTPFYRNIIIAGGPAPTRAYIDDLLPDVMQGRIQPGRVFDRTVDLEGVPDGYRARNDREGSRSWCGPDSLMTSGSTPPPQAP